MKDQADQSDRYRKQELFAGLGPAGQARLGRSRVLIVGAGALGGTEAQLLVRAGVGFVRVVDRDAPELTNLHRQLLYDEEDLASGLPKAILAERKLRAMNSGVEVEGVVAEVGPANILDLMADVDLVLDGLDNQTGRFLINDAAVKLGRPWIWAGVVGAAGNVAVIIPGQTPCLRCLLHEPAPAGSLPSVDTAGVIGPLPSLVASVVAAEALKILVGAGDKSLPGLLGLDLWLNEFKVIPLGGAIRPDCPCCQGRRFDFLAGGPA